MSTSLQMQHSLAAERNRQPILDVLRQVLPVQGSALEIASGTGQHAAWFAAALPGWRWQPTDFEAQALPGIAAWCEGLANVLPPLRLDVTAPQWPIAAGAYDAVFCANMLHISPWETCEGLMSGCRQHLAPAGVLLTYGPYWEQDVPPAPGNVAFDASLRSRNRLWGIRQLQAVCEQARLQGLQLSRRFEMPANNLLLVFDRT